MEASQPFLSKEAILPWAGGCGHKAQQSPGSAPLTRHSPSECSQQRQGKRAATEAKLDSGSKVVPRKEDKQSNSLNTPTNSDTLSAGDVRFTSKDLRDPSAVLKNCPEVNQL